MTYGEVQGKTWRSPSIRGLSDVQKLAWSYLLSNQHSNMLGYYLLPLPYMADDLEWTIEKTKKAANDLESRGLIAYDHATQIVLICKYLKYNRLSSGAREKGALSRLEDLPESPLLLRLFAAVNEWHPQLADLRAYLEKQKSLGTLFGVQEESKGTPQGDIDIDIGQDGDGGLGKDSSYSSDFESFWTIFKKLRRAEAKPKTLEHWNATIAGRDGETGHPPVVASVIIMAAGNYRDYCVANKIERQYIMQSASFVGPKKRGWEAYMEPIKTEAQKNDAKLREWAGIKEE